MTVPSPSSEELLDEWRMLMIEEQDAPTCGGSLLARELRQGRKEWRTERLDEIAKVLIERMWAEPPVQR